MGLRLCLENLVFLLLHTFCFSGWSTPTFSSWWTSMRPEKNTTSSLNCKSCHLTTRNYMLLFYSWACSAGAGPEGFEQMYPEGMADRDISLSIWIPSHSQDTSVWLPNVRLCLFGFRFAFVIFLPQNSFNVFFFSLSVYSAVQYISWMLYLSDQTESLKVPIQR